MQDSVFVIQRDRQRRLKVSKADMAGVARPGQFVPLEIACTCVRF